MESKTTLPMLEILTPIWQRVLQRPFIRMEDNFFDLGGDSSLAAKLFSEIAEACRRDISPLTVLHAPTIASLAALLMQPGSPRLPTVIPLKAGLKDPPVFISPGLGANLLDLLPLARHIQSPHPVLGMIARGVDGADKPFERVEDIAGLYLDAITKIQPHGPYFLIGGSFGGLVMMEIAQRLLQKGERVGLLAMLDSYPDIRFLSLTQRTRLHSRRARNRISVLSRQPMGEVISYIVDHVRDQFSTSGNRRKRARDPLPRGLSLSPTMRRLHDSDYLALASYRPRFYPGKIRFVRAERDPYFPDDAAAIWKNLASEVEVETVLGNHLEMITTHYEGLAAVLSRYLREALP